MPGPTPRPVDPARLREVKARVRQRFAAETWVCGVGTGDGCVRVYVTDRQAGATLPGAVDGVPLEAVFVTPPRADEAGGP